MITRTYTAAYTSTPHEFNALFVQAELTFSAGDIIYVFGDMDVDGFYYVSVFHVCLSVSIFRSFVQGHICGCATIEVISKGNNTSCEVIAL